MEYIGIDISKDCFDAFHRGLGNRQFSNDEKGYHSLMKWVSESEVHCVMEASGPYYLRLSAWLHDRKIPVSIINPLVIRRFCQMNLQRAKTDKKDAQAIASFAVMTNPSAWKPAIEEVQQIRQLLSVLEQLSKQLTATRNAEEALFHHPKMNKKAYQSLEQVKKVQQEQIQQLEKEINQLTEKNFGAQVKQLTSIPGIGKKTATMLIVITDGFTRFNHKKQLVAYVGLSPRIFQSGKTVNRKPRIAKMGMGEIRRLLFMCSFQAIRSKRSMQTALPTIESKREGGKSGISCCSKQTFTTSVRTSYEAANVPNRIFVGLI